MLVTMKEILDRASAENYGVAAPNVNTELDARCALEAAEELNAPIILDVGGTANPDIVFYGSFLTRLADASTWIMAAAMKKLCLRCAPALPPSW